MVVQLMGLLVVLELPLAVVGELVVEEVVVAIVYVLEVWMVVVVLLPYPLWSHYIQYILSLSSNSTSSPSTHLSSLFIVQLNPT